MRGLGVQTKASAPKAANAREYRPKLGRNSTAKSFEGGSAMAAESGGPARSTERRSAQLRPTSYCWAPHTKARLSQPPKYWVLWTLDP